VKVEGFAVAGGGTGRAEEALASAQGCRATELKPAPLRVFAPVDDLKAGKAGIFALGGEVEGSQSECICSIAAIQGDDRGCSHILNDEAIVFIGVIGSIHRGGIYLELGMPLFSPFQQRLGIRGIGLVCWGYPDLQRQLGFGIHDKMDLIAEEDVFLGFMPPTGIRIGVFPGAVAPPLTGAGLFAKFVRVCPEVGGIHSGIPTDDYLEDYSLSNQAVEDVIENVVSQAVTEVGEGAIGRCLQEIESAKEAEPSIITQGRGKFAV